MFVRPGGPFRRLTVALLAALSVYSPGWSALPEAPVASAQIIEGATLTVMATPVDVQQAANGFLEPGFSGQTLQIGDRVLAGPGGSARVSFFDGSEVDLSSETELRLGLSQRQQDGGSAIGIGLALGTTLSRVQQLLTPSSTFRVETPRAVGLTRGTTFETVVQSDREERHRGLEGELDVEVAGTSRLVRVGDTILLPSFFPVVICGGQPITVDGSGFRSGASLTFGQAAALDVTTLDDLTISAITPPHPPGPVDVRVTNPDGKFGELVDGYIYGSNCPA